MAFVRLKTMTSCLLGKQSLDHGCSLFVYSYTYSLLVILILIPFILLSISYFKH